MKDEHDKSTIELPALAPAQGATVHSLVLNPSRVRELRRMQGLPTFVPVALVASEWSVSARRIRALLCAGRLQGRQLENGYWEVSYPYSMTMGTRGPQLRKFGGKKQELLKERTK